MSNATSHSDNNPVSRFLTNFPSYVQCTGTHYFPNIRVFWSQIQRHHDALVIQEKIKTAFYNLNISHLNGLIQFWAPTPAGMLSTSDQPFVLEHLDSCFLKYRLCCMTYQYNIDDDAPPASAFLNCFPEVLLDLRPHRRGGLLSQCDFTSSIFLPVFCPTSLYCVGVVECSVKHSSALVQLFNSLTISLQIVGLITLHVQGYRPYKTIPCLTHAINEVEEALAIICASLDLPLVQVWIAYENKMNKTFLSSFEKKKFFGLKLIGYCYDSNDDRLSFLKNYHHTCNMLPLKMGEGLAGKALQTYEPHFCRDVYELSDYGLLGVLTGNTNCSCLAICLRNIDTGNLDYAFEFLWSKNRNYFILLESILLTLKWCLPNFKFSAGAELDDEMRVLDVENSTGSGTGFFKIFEKSRLSQIPKSLVEPRRLVAYDCISASNVKQISKGSKKKAATIPNVSFSIFKSRNGLGSPERQEPKLVKRELSDLNLEDNQTNQEDSSRSNSVSCLGNGELIIEAEYRDQRTLSCLPISSKIVDIKKNVEDKYKLVSGSYKIQFLDFENEWIRLDDEEDWESCIMSFRIVGTQTIRLCVRPFTG